MKKLLQLLRRHLLLVFGSIFLLGSWIAQNFLESKWSSESQRMFNWLNIQEIAWSDAGNWHIAILQYQSHYEEIKGRDSLLNLINNRRYAGLCRNWLQLYYGFLNMHYEVSEPDKDKRTYIQKKILDTLHSLSFELNHTTIPLVVRLFNRKVQQSVNEVRMSGQLIRNRIKYVEDNEEKWNKLFLLSYIIGTLLLALDFIVKAMKEKR